MNGGAWLHVQSRIETILKETKHHSDLPVKFVGRDPSAATATGFKSVHDAQVKKLVQDALG